MPPQQLQNKIFQFLTKKGETLKEYWNYVDQIFTWSDDKVANMILDDGGDATLYIILGAKAEKGEQVLPNPANEEEEALKAQILSRIESSPGWFTKVKIALKGLLKKQLQGFLDYIKWQKKVIFLSQQSMLMTQ